LSDLRFVAKHGHARKGLRSGAYASWQQMRKRCLNPNTPQFRWYGGAGVTISPRWDSFENFLADMGERPAGASLDRWPDRAGNYEPGNCRWATRAQQALERRNARFIEWEGKRLQVAQWAELLGVNEQTLHTRLRSGMPLERIMRPGDLRAQRQCVPFL